MKLLAITVAAIAVGACSDQLATRPITGLGRISASVMPAVDTSGLVLTPNGYYHRDCVYEVPEGARYTQGAITRRDGSTNQVPACVEGGPVTAAGQPIPKHPNNPSTHGWVTAGVATVTSGSTIHQIGARWVVPQIPAVYGGSSSPNYLFPGAENTGFATVIQPVLQYGAATDGGGQYWSISGFMCGHICVHSTLQQVYVGDVLGGTVNATNCSAGYCDWAIEVADSTLGRSTTLIEGAGDIGYGETADTYFWAVGGALEIWNETSCSNLSGGQHLFSQLSFLDQNGSAMSLTWTYDPDTAVTPHCGYGATSTGSTNATVLDSLAPLLTAQISGPTGVPYQTSGTWDAAAGLPGTPPYTYEWTGILSGTSSTVSGVPSGSGFLYLEMWDSAGNTAISSLYVTVCEPTQITC